MVRTFTHVATFDGGEQVSQIGARPDRNRFAAPLRRQDGVRRWGLGLFPLPDGMTYDEMLTAGQDFTEYLQAGGKADALTVEIRKTGGRQWGVTGCATSSVIRTSRVFRSPSRYRCRPAHWPSAPRRCSMPRKPLTSVAELSPVGRHPRPLCAAASRRLQSRRLCR
jgi:hypothetical protein